MPCASDFARYPGGLLAKAKMLEPLTPSKAPLGTPFFRRASRALARIAAAAIASLLGITSAHAGYDAELVWDKVFSAKTYNIYIRFVQGAGGPPSQTARKIVVNASSAPAAADERIHFAVTDLLVGPTAIFSITSQIDSNESPRSNEMQLTYATVARYIDSDGDGLLDFEEDTDLDLIHDPGETDSRNPDTDGDGLSDGEEVYRTFTDPRSADSDDDGTPDGPDTCNDVDRDGFGSAATSSTNCKWDNCPFHFNPGQVDSDYDSVGEACDPCTNVAGLQDFGDRGTVASFRRVFWDDIRGNDGFKMRGEFALPPATAFSTLDPSADGARVVVEAFDGRPLANIEIPGGLKIAGTPRGWKADPRGNKYRYSDRSSERINGIVKILVKDMSKRTPRAVRVVVKARDGDYPVSPSVAPVRVVVILGNHNASKQGACGETAFGTDSCRASNKRTVVCN